MQTHPVLSSPRTLMTAKPKWAIQSFSSVQFVKSYYTIGARDHYEGRRKNSRVPQQRCWKDCSFGYNVYPSKWRISKDVSSPSQLSLFHQMIYGVTPLAVHYFSSPYIFQLFTHKPPWMFKIFIQAVLKEIHKKMTCVWIQRWPLGIQPKLSACYLTEYSCSDEVWPHTV